ncbi:MAG: glycosyltransferase family 4 protein [Nodosilinea sp.]
MNKIRLAYDISSLGTYFSWPDSKTGIYRVAEEILNQVIQSDELDTTLVGLCGEAPAFTSLGCRKYFEFWQEQNSSNSKSCEVNFQSTYESHIHLRWLYEAIYNRYFSKDFQKKNKRSLESLLIRGPLKLMDLMKLARLDTYRIFTPDDFDILHSTYYKLPPRELTQDLPRLITIYDLIPLTAKEFVNPKLNSYFYQILDSVSHEQDWVACISEYTRREFCKYTGFPEDRTYVTYLAADDIFTPIDNLDDIERVRQSNNIPEAPYFLCLASHLDPRKNIFHLIKSFVRLIRENPSLDVNLVLIGTLRFKREDVTKALQEFDDYRHRIIFTGYVADEDLSAIYNGSVAFVFPSLYEGFGLPVLEAMQSGTPVISSNSTSLPEVTGNAAILVDPQDEDALCQAMLTLLSDESLRQQMIEKGLARAKLFSWQKCAAETIDIYKTIVASHG